MGTKRSTWTLLSGILAAGCAAALAIVIIDMIVDSWLTPITFGSISILGEFLLAVAAAILFFLRLPLGGLIVAVLAFIFGEILGRTVTDGNGIFWPFTTLPDLARFAEDISPLYAFAVALLDVAFVLIVATMLMGLIAVIAPATSPGWPSPGIAAPAVPSEQGIPAGWYPDPEGRPCQRYWDGTAWTESTAPLG